MICAHSESIFLRVCLLSTSNRGMCTYYEVVFKDRNFGAGRPKYKMTSDEAAAENLEFNEIYRGIFEL